MTTQEPAHLPHQNRSNQNFLAFWSHVLLSLKNPHLAIDKCHIHIWISVPGSARARWIVGPHALTQVSILHLLAPGLQKMWSRGMNLFMCILFPTQSSRHDGRLFWQFCVFSYRSVGCCLVWTCHWLLGLTHRWLCSCSDYTSGRG